MKPVLNIVVALAGLGCIASPAPAQTTARVDASKQYQTFEGFGTSLSWWANGVGSWDEPARSNLVDALFAPPPRGLGLVYARYNIGGGDCPCYHTIVYPHAVPGYKRRKEDPFDWNADAPQRWVAQRAYALGAVYLEAQSNSPPWWMTVSGSSTGSRDAASSNMADARTGAGPDGFPAYLASVVGHFASDFGLVFRHVEATNEPDTAWWKFASAKQEGAAVTPAQQQTINRNLAALLPRYSPRTMVAAMDGYNLDHTAAIFDGYSAQAKAAVDQVNTHTYEGAQRARLAAIVAAAGKRVVMSEWGSPETSGKALSQEITRDLREMKPLAWAIWQPDWPTLVTIDYKKHTYRINKNYYVFANYTRYLRPGSVFIDIDDANSLAALDGRNKVLTIVSANWSASSVPVSYALASFTRLGASAHGYRTSASENLADIGTVALSDQGFSATLPAGSVTTWVIDGAGYEPHAESVNDTAFAYSSSDCGPGWCAGRQDGAHAGDQHWSARPGSTYRYTFTGTQARVYGALARDQGIAAFSVDGGAETDVDLYAPARLDDRLTFVTPTLARGVHTIRVRVTGLKNHDASGALVQADRIDVVD